MVAASELPIGLFDSGMGGLTVFSALSTRLPQEDLLYLGDTARLPYGTKSRDTIVRYTLQAAKKLILRGVKMLVCACNTATANALPELQRHFPDLPILGVVMPGAREAVRVSQSGRILLLATEATIRSNVYAQAIVALRPDAVPSARACTLFVPMAEEGLMEGKIVEDVAKLYLSDILAADAEHKPDTVILGCTHFPLLKGALCHVVGPDITVVDPACAVAASVAEELQRLDLHKKTEHPVRYHYMTTDNRERFAKIGSLFLGRPLAEDSIELIDL